MPDLTPVGTVNLSCKMVGFDDLQAKLDRLNHALEEVIYLVNDLSKTDNIKIAIVADPARSECRN